MGQKEIVFIIAIFLVVAGLFAVSFWVFDYGGKTPYVVINLVKIKVDIADSSEEWQQGLMFRDSLASNEGMLFVDSEAKIRSFWMKDMKFPIDIIFINSDRAIVHIEKAVPPCTQDPCPTYSSQEPAQYVLEVNAGFSDQFLLKRWDKIEFYNLPPMP